MTESTPQRNKRLRATGKVVGTKMDKTIVVQVTRMERHPKYGKYVRRYTKHHAHDESNNAKQGDVVEIVQTRPLSKTKRWRLLRIIQHAPSLG